jgi:hypothetical protein
VAGKIWENPRENPTNLGISKRNWKNHFGIFNLLLCLVGAGHYLFTESSNRVLNGTARLFSPVYGPPKASAAVNEEVCFSFWFHMYGSTTGKIVELHPDIILYKFSYFYY